MTELELYYTLTRPTGCKEADHRMMCRVYDELVRRKLVDDTYMAHPAYVYGRVSRSIQHIIQHKRDVAISIAAQIRMELL